MPRPLLSVVIPTHNRARYAIHAIRSLLSLDASAEILEIVVHDTSTNAELRDWVGNPSNADARLRYMHSTDSLDLTQNHNRALAMASGRYVCLIGDDDTILPGMLALALFAEARGIECVAPRVVANYAWPDFVSRTFGSAHAGRLYFSKSYGGLENKLTGPALSASLKRAAQGTEGLPKLYHGLVRSDVIEAIRSKTGDYVHGASPDVSAAIAIAASIENFVELDFPVTLPGASGGSNTGASAMGKHKGDLHTTRQTARYASTWSALIPAFYSVETVWAHAACVTLQLLKNSALDQFNYPELYAQCLLRHRTDASHTIDSMKHYEDAHSLSALSLGLKCALSATGIVSREVARLAVRALTPTAAGNRRHFDALETVAEAQSRAIDVVASDDVNLAGLLRKELQNQI